MRQFSKFSRHIFAVAVGLFILSAHIEGQTPPIRTPQAPAAPAPMTKDADGRPTLDFGSVPVGTIAFQTRIIFLQIRQQLTVTQQTGVNFKHEITKGCEKAVTKYTRCTIVIGFSPSSATEFDDTLTIAVNGVSPDQTLDLSGTGLTPADAAGSQATAAATPTQAAPNSPPTAPTTTVLMPVSKCSAPNRVLFPTIRHSLLAPGPSSPAGSEDLAKQVSVDFGINAWSQVRDDVINCFYNTNSSLAFITQVKSVYSASSGSATISANVLSFNFSNGMQASLGTNFTAGPNANSASTQPGTLSSTSAAQAAQNIFFGGNVFLYADLPLVTKKLITTDRWHYQDDILVREGVDLQSFSGTSTVVSSPPTHFNVLDEMYYQYDSIPSTGATPSTLSVFVGGQYGYAYTSGGYAQQYGFGKKTSAQVGDIGGGVLLSGQYNITVLREFGPAQAYVDATTGMPTQVNNFKSFTFSIQYQGSGLSAK